MNNDNASSNFTVREIIVKTSKILRIYPVLEKLAIIFLSKRNKLAKKYIKGKGIEIGALHTPLKISPKNAKVIYIDRMNNVELRNHYPELKSYAFVKTGLIDDGEMLKKFTDASQDFVIANHFIEHCENPLITLRNHIRVVKEGGIIFWAVPNKKYTFDNKRKITPNKHLWLDYLKGPDYSKTRHYEDWVKIVLGYSDEQANKKIRELIKSKYSIHYHVWTPEKFKKFLDFARKKLNLNFKILELRRSINEFIVILQKC